MRASLDRLAEIAFDRVGERPVVAEPPDPAGIPDMGGRMIPGEVRDLYSIADLVGAYNIDMSAARQLPAVNEEFDDLMTDYPLMDIGDLPWGPPPIGHTLTIGPKPLYVAELDGRPSGVTLLDVGGDEGYRWMAPSLERLFETWVAVAEAGLIELGHASGVPHLLPRREGRDIGKAADVCHRLSCSIVAVGLYSYAE